MSRPPTNRSHYKTIGAAQTATAAELRSAYLTRARSLHPDQFVDLPEAERNKAERRMQDLNAAWTVLSNPATRRSYDSSIAVAEHRGTKRIVSARDKGWRPFDSRRRPPPPERKPGPPVADRSEMEVRGAARLVRPFPLFVVFASVAALIVAIIMVGGGGPARVNDRPPIRVAVPTGRPLGCIDLLPAAEAVPCGDHDAVVWSVISAGESCTEGLEAVYRQGSGGLFCVTLVG